MASSKVIGVAWFRREDYERIKAICDDEMVATFDQWEARMQEKVADLERQLLGVRCERVIVHPDELVAFARARGHAKIDSKVRSEFAAVVVSKQNGHSH